MSRLIVKNLPPYVTPARLREHFEQKGGPGGTITDVKVASKPDGTSRRFGFVGYKNDEEAGVAKEWFDRTFIDSTRINVIVIEGTKDAPTPRPNKRPRLGPAPSESQKPLSSGIFDSTVDMEHDTKEEGISDLDWMKRRITDSVDVVEKVFEQDEEVQPPLNSQDLKETAANGDSEPLDLTKTTILQTSRLFVRNLAFLCSEADLLELFKPFGEVSQVHIPLDALLKQPKGLAYVTFAKPTSALAAYETLDRRSFQGRLLHILAAVDRKGKFEIEEGDGKKRTLKEERDSKRKTTAGQAFNWSMLYMNSDAVASSVADRMNISKADILNPESDNAAVKLALAETHVIQETKSYLESQGVILSSFSSRARSDTVILVKNIPYGTTAEQIKELFEPHGTLTRILVPPAGTMAVVEFAHPDDSSRAFRAVAYRRLGSSIVYLEKGPTGMFLEGAIDNQSGLGVSSAVKAVLLPEQEGNQADADDEEPALNSGSTLFIKNLAFATTTERLTQVFRHLPSFSFARVQTKPDPKRPSVPGSGVEAPRLSMGYGFIGFKDKESARKALKAMQGFVLDGHALYVKFAGRGAEEDVSKGNVVSKSKTTKMIVKNVPFEATKKDIRELFGSHGQLKSVRLPKKFDSRTRGFAFLDFITRHEAENAYAALQHTHLLGRHLILEWAEDAEQDLDVLRKKAGVGFGDGREMPGRKRKIDLGGDVGGADENDL